MVEKTKIEPLVITCATGVREGWEQGELLKLAISGIPRQLRYDVQRQRGSCHQTAADRNTLGRTTGGRRRTRRTSTDTRLQIGSMNQKGSKHAQSWRRPLERNRNNGRRGTDQRSSGVRATRDPDARETWTARRRTGTLEQATVKKYGEKHRARTDATSTEVARRSSRAHIYLVDGRQLHGNSVETNRSWDRKRSKHYCIERRHGWKPEARAEPESLAPCGTAHT